MGGGEYRCDMVRLRCGESVLLARITARAADAQRKLQDVPAAMVETEPGDRSMCRSVVTAAALIVSLPA